MLSLMQWMALEEKRWVKATDAEKGKDYRCPECEGTLHLRSGLARRPHFYHLAKSEGCRQAGKSEAHLEAQLYLQRCLEGALLEHRFPEVGRVADVMWPQKRVIFEVQCSPIEPEEALARNADYAKCGFQVIWILHAHRYHAAQLKSVERALLNYPHYYTNIDEHGAGMIFDRRWCLEAGQRRWMGEGVELEISQIVPQIPRWLGAVLPLRQRTEWPIYCAGDCSV